MDSGIEIKLADGNFYTFPPLALASLEALQKDIAAFQGGTDAASIQTVVKAALHSLRRNYPQMTRQDLLGVFHEDENGDIVWDKRPLLDIGNMLEVMQAVMDVSGIKAKEQREGKALAGSPSSLNGARSTAN